MVNYDGLYRSEIYKEAFSSNPFSDKQLNFKVYENGTILPHRSVTVNGNWTRGVGGIVDSEGNWIKESFVLSEQGLGAYTPEEKVPHFDTTVVYLTMYFPV